jgi:hypothetical protein
MVGLLQIAWHKPKMKGSLLYLQNERVPHPSATVPGNDKFVWHEKVSTEK